MGQLLGTSFCVHLASHSLNEIPLQPSQSPEPAVYKDDLLSQIIPSPIFWYGMNARNVKDYARNSGDRTALEFHLER